MARAIIPDLRRVTPEREELDRQLIKARKWAVIMEQHGTRNSASHEQVLDLENKIKELENKEL